VNTWHNRNYYSAEKIDSYNEQPWGLGIGKYRFDDDGDWNALYVMAFADSHNKIEPIVGYGFQKMWRPTDNFRLGAGYTVGITIRDEMNYVPIPVIAPLVSVEYKRLSLQSTYIPGGNGNGNILFTWLRWQIHPL
jgi:palmitoyl transferase